MGKILWMADLLDRRRGEKPRSHEEHMRTLGWVQWKVENWRGMEERDAKKRAERAAKRAMKRPHLSED